MKNTNHKNYYEKYTSLELSKKLHENGCELESKYLRLLSSGGVFGTGNNVCNIYDILSDICCRYAKNFFGERDVCTYCGKYLEPTDVDNDNDICDCDYDICDCDSFDEEEAWRYHTKEVFRLMQQGKKEEAEKYIWEHTIFNPKNKE